MIADRNDPIPTAGSPADDGDGLAPERIGQIVEGGESLEEVARIGETVEELLEPGASSHPEPVDFTLQDEQRADRRAASSSFDDLDPARIEPIPGDIPG